MRRPAI